MKRNIFIFILFLIWPLLVNADNKSESQYFLVTSALKEMLDARTDPFLIIEVAGTKKYIQFYNENPGILLDLPTNTLNQAEIDKASVFFEKHGIEKRETIATNVNNRKEFVILGWRHVYKNSDLEKVVSITLEALSEIYGINEITPLTFVRGWE